MSIKEQVERVKETLKDYPKAKIVASTKYMTVEQVLELYHAGIKEFGENRSSLLCEKYEALKDYKDITWHFFGHLQTRKVKDVVDKVRVIHSLDNIKLAQEINKRVQECIDCFIEVNISGEETKSGVNEPFKEHIQDLIKACLSLNNIRIVGLMCVAENTNDERKLREDFKTMKALQEYFQSLNIAKAPCLELSMGMSQDYKIALEEGSSLVRIGRYFLE